MQPLIARSHAAAPPAVPHATGHTAIAFECAAAREDARTDPGADMLTMRSARQTTYEFFHIVPARACIEKTGIHILDNCASLPRVCMPVGTYPISHVGMPNRTRDSTTAVVH